MTNELIDQKQIELHFEKANMAGEQAEKHVKSLVNVAIIAGAALTEAKALIPHGEWMAYLKKHWDYSAKTAARYMLISNFTRGLNLTEAKSIKEALRMIAEDQEEKSPPPRADRIPDRVEVVESAIERDHIVDAGTDDDPTPDPPTQRKTAKGSEKVSEDSKPKTQAITPEIVDDDTGPTDAVEAYLESVSPVQIIRDVLTRITDDATRMKEVRQIRRELDKFDPPTKFVKPTVEEVAAYCHDRGNTIDAESFVAHYSANGWKLSNGNKLADWKSAVITWEKNNGANNRTGNRKTLTGSDWA